MPIQIDIPEQGDCLGCEGNHWLISHRLLSPQALKAFAEAYDKKETIGVLMRFWDNTKYKFDARVAAMSKRGELDIEVIGPTTFPL